MPENGSMLQQTATVRDVRSVRITIDLSAIRANLATARYCSAGSRQFATIKADAYGHGAVAVARALSEPLSDSTERQAHTANVDVRAGNADGFAVVTVDEAIELREAGIRQPVLVLQGPQTADACIAMQAHDLWPVIHDLHQYEWYRRNNHRQHLSAWLKVDTGMGRLGVRPDEAQTILASNDNINWRGLMTHFACADEVSNPFTHDQIARFRQVHYQRSLESSLSNSAAVLAWPDARGHWARPGIMLYGCNPLDCPLPEGVSLQPAMSVTAPLISVKIMTGGSTIGYARTYTCPEDMPVGYAALGYRDGLPRVLDASASVMLGKNRCPIIGRVSMDSVAVDLRNAPGACPGELAEFWGRQASIDALAKSAGTINYELLTSIRGRRQYVGGDYGLHRSL